MTRFIPSGLMSARRLLRDSSGVAAIEFALVISMLLVLLLNGIEFARWYYTRIQVQNAAEMAVQAVWKTCDTVAKSPATVNCPAHTTAISTALQSTALGSAVTLSSGFPTEAHYCIDALSNPKQLIQVAAASAAKPADCTAANQSATAAKPGTHIVIQAQTTFNPLFRGVSLGSALPTTIQVRTMMRLQ